MKLLEVAKAAETRDMVYLVMRDEKAKRVAVAWTMVVSDYQDAPALKNQSPSDCYRDAWNRVRSADMTLLATLAGLPLDETQEAFQRLRTCGLIYPDHTIHKILMNILRAEIGVYVRGLVPRQAEFPKIPPDPRKPGF